MNKQQTSIRFQLHLYKATFYSAKIKTFLSTLTDYTVLLLLANDIYAMFLGQSVKVSLLSCLRLTDKSSFHKQMV